MYCMYINHNNVLKQQQKKQNDKSTVLVWQKEKTLCFWYKSNGPDWIWQVFWVDKTKVMLCCHHHHHWLLQVASVAPMSSRLGLLWLLLVGGVAFVTASRCTIGRSAYSLQQQDEKEHSSCRIFLDHGDQVYHGEVFYSIAVLMTTRHWPGLNLTFLVHRDFAMSSGLLDFWEKHSHEGVLGE